METRKKNLLDHTNIKIHVEFAFTEPSICIFYPFLSCV